MWLYISLPVIIFYGEKMTKGFLINIIIICMALLECYSYLISITVHVCSVPLGLVNL